MSGKFPTTKDKKLRGLTSPQQPKEPEPESKDSEDKKEE